MYLKRAKIIIFIIIISIAFLEISFAQSIQSKLSFCENSCRCQPPFISEISEYIIKPECKRRNTLQCLVSVDYIYKLLSCLNLVVETAENKQCSKSQKYNKNASKDCNNFQNNFVLPPTLEVTSQAPKRCGYKWKYFDRYEYLKLTKEFIKSGEIGCTKSMCTSATFLALVSHAKKLYQSKKISKEEFEELTTPHKKAYKMLNTSAEPNELVETFGIGTGYTFNIKDKKFGQGPIPQIGDIAQLWRKNGSGHSVVIKGFIDENKDGINDLVCYWSSQKASKGYGLACEPINTLSKVLVGHLGK